MSYIKCIVQYQGREFKIKCCSNTSVAGLQVKLRRYIKLQDHEACFLFFTDLGYFNKTRLYPGSKLLCDIARENYGGGDILHVNLCRENTFGNNIDADG